MRLVDYLDKGASLDPDAPCLRAGDRVLSYRDVQSTSDAVARALAGSGIEPGDKVAILSANDPTAFSCVFGISRAGAVWCPINPRNEARENRQLLELFECRALIFQRAFAPLVEQILPDLPALAVVVCLDPGEQGDPGEEGEPGEQGEPGVAGVAGALDFARWTGDAPPAEASDGEWVWVDPIDDVAMIVGTGGTTGLPKGVQLTSRNLETMTAITLMSYPFSGRPTYLALAPLTHAAGVLSFPVLTRGGQIVIMAAPDMREFLRLIERHRVTHTMLTPTLLYMMLGHRDLDRTDLSSIQCFWYGSAPMSAARLEEALVRIGPGLRSVLRPDGGADGRDHDGAGRSLPRGRLDRGRATVLGRAGGTVGHPGDHVARRRADAGAGARRDRLAQLVGDAGLLPQRSGHGRRRLGSAGTTPATSGISTRTASCSSSIAPRT